MSDAPSADAGGGGGVWGSFKRFVGNVELARQGFYLGGIEAAINTAASIGVMAQHPILPPSNAPLIMAGRGVGPAAGPPEEAPAPMGTGHPSADFMLKYDPVTQLAAGFVFAGRELWRGHWFEGGYMLAKPEAEVSMIAFGAVIGGGSGTSPKGVPQIGGTYSSVRQTATARGLGGQVHHMPSWAATEGAGIPGATKLNTPSIWMEVADHGLTASHGWAGNAGAIFRARQQTLIAQGRYLDAMMMDVEHIRSLFGTKYNGAIQQMGEAFWRANQ